MSLSESGNQWERAFQLAFFIIPDRPSALEIAGNAIEKLGSQRSRERRRIYWRGRNKKLRIRRISRPDEDTLQWLIYLESETHEKTQEQCDEQTEVDMVIRYVKHLVQLTTGASSFYVNVGLNRLLRSYSTPEVQQIYEFTTEHYPASEEYRKVKGRLMNALISRFDRFLRVQTSEYRELRFEAYEDQKRWMSIVEECLESFTPWSSQRACLERSIDLQVGEPGTGVWHPTLSGHADGIETNRCHWFMHTPCYSELVKKLGFDAPDQRLSVPLFSRPENSRPEGPPNIAGRKTTRLSEDEMRALKDRIDSGEAKRRQAPAQQLKIVAHGIVHAHLNPYLDERRQFGIPDGTKLLEVHSEVNGADVTLATHWIDYTECDGMAAGDYTIALKDKRELLFTVVPASSDNKEEGGAVVLVQARSTSPLIAWFHRIASFFDTRQRFLGYAFAAVFFGWLGWVAGTTHYRSKAAQVQIPVQQTIAQTAGNTVPQQQSPALTHRIPSYLLASGVPSLRGTENAKEPVVTFAPDNPLVMLDLSISGFTKGSYRATLSNFVDDQELLREDGLIPQKKDGGWIVEFAVPYTLVTNDSHYLVTLVTIDSVGKATPVSRFLFKAQK